MRQTIKILMIAALFAACKKDDKTSDPNQNPSTPKTPKELMTNSWTPTSIYSNKPGDPNPEQIDECRKDDTWTFKSDGTFLIDNAATPCPDDNNDLEPGIWNIDHYPMLITKLNSNTTAYSDTFNLVQLDETYFKYEFENDNEGNTITVTLKRK